MPPDNSDSTAGDEEPIPARLPGEGYERVQVPDADDAGLFDCDSLRGNPDLELWLFRTPQNVSSKYLRGLELRLPPTSSESVGTVSRRDKTYDVRLLPARSHPQDGILGEDMNSLVCMLPRRSKALAHYYRAPLPIARQFIVLQSDVSPSPPPPLPPTPPPPRPQPLDRLVHVFNPIGSLPADLQPALPSPPTPPATEQRSGSSPALEKKQKRKRKQKEKEARSSKKVKREA